MNTKQISSNSSKQTNNYTNAPSTTPSTTSIPYYQQPSLAPPPIPSYKSLSPSVPPPPIPTSLPPPVPTHAAPSLPISQAPVLPPPLPPSLKLSSTASSSSSSSSSNYTKSTSNPANSNNNSSKSVGNIGNFSNTKLRMRSPWIVNRNNYSSVLTLEDPELLKTIAKEIYSTAIPIDSLERINASQTITLLSNRNPVISGKIQVSLRTWPSAKQSQRETRKAVAADLGGTGTGISPQAIQELAMLQHIHYLSTISNDSIESGINSHVMLPIGIMEIPDINSITSTRKSIKKESIAEINKKYTIANNSSISSEIASLMSSSEKATNGSIYSSGSFSPINSTVISDEVTSTSKVTPSKGGLNNNSIQKYLIIPSVLTSLQAFLPNILSYTKSMSNILLTASLARDLCKDLMLAIQHCTKCGVYFKWIPLDQIYITNEGRLLLGGLSGASIVMPPDLEVNLYISRCIYLLIYLYLYLNISYLCLIFLSILILT
jgi:hypothetical protein